MKSIRLTFMLILVLAPVVADAAKPIMNLRNVPVSVKTDGTSHSAQEVQAVIIKGCLARGWSAVLDGKGVIRATINVRGMHFAEIEIPYTSTDYSILYVSSNNLDYNERSQSIHRNYNNWVVKLSGTINKLLRTTSSETMSASAGARANNGNDRNPDDIYSEILKLDDLRKKGILSDEEFEQQKKRVLEAQ